MSIQIYILSKLMEGESYPYQLKKEISASIPIDKIANVTESKLYYHFESLTKQGLIEPSRVIQEENRPDKQLYSVTKKGKEALPEKIYDVFKKASKMSEIIIGLMFLQYVEIEKVEALIQVKKMSLQTKAQDIASIYEHVQAPDDMVQRVQLANAYYTDMMQREIGWFDQVLLLLQTEKQKQMNSK